MHLNGFQCIQQLFLCVNERQNKLNTLKKEFRVHVIPSHLEGMSFMWQYFKQCCLHKDSQDLKHSVTQFIA